MQSSEERLRYWEPLVREWQESGQCKAAYCRTRDLRPWQFYYWCSRVLERDRDSPVGFALVDTSSLDSGLRLHLGGGIELSLAKDFDEPTLSRLLSMSCW